MVIRLAIIEDNPAYCKALQHFISKDPEISIVSLKENLENVEEEFVELQPDVVLMDINLPGMSGIEGVELLKNRLPQIAIIILTVFEQEDKIFQSLKAGALGYLLKKDPPAKIVEAVKEVYHGQSVMNGQVARKILNFFAGPSVRYTPSETYHLTRREMEILGLLKDGLLYKEIAARLSLSPETVKKHLKNIYGKLHVQNKIEALNKFRLL